jgi:poly-gamma-glutamate capsule biosynthesis protein CapA/YwtB (metallophosphatase superfamily)
MEASTSADRQAGRLTVFLCGDVMTGRGIDHALPHPSHPRIHEPSVTDAGEYVRLAEAANGPIPRPVGFSYIWGAALDESSGIPSSWAATNDRPGIDVLPDLSETTATGIVQRVRAVKRARDVVVASIHWGSNWGYEVPAGQQRFARRLLDGGVDIVHGHSSHHVRPIEVYRGKLILYGCGDFLNDYEGITGYDEFRDDLTLMYFATLQPETGRLVSRRMTPMQIRNLRVNRAAPQDAEWLGHTLARISRAFGARVNLTADGTLALHCE